MTIAVLGGVIQEWHWKQSVIHKTCAQGKKALRYTEQTNINAIYLSIPSDCYT